MAQFGNVGLLSWANETGDMIINVFITESID